MSFPWFHALPTKVKVTLFAVHMIAALILLNRLSTLRIWARFCISQKPWSVFSVRIIFCVPCFKHLTVSWPMRFLTTLETERITTKTCNNFISREIVYSLNCIVALFRIRTPFNRGIIISEFITMISHILC